jgi:hypothetical protein
MLPETKLKLRLEPVVEELLSCRELEVEDILIRHNVTWSEFLELDEHPGIWGDDCYDWHWKIRRFRNDPDGLRRYGHALMEENHETQS